MPGIVPINPSTGKPFVVVSPQAKPAPVNPAPYTTDLLTGKAEPPAVTAKAQIVAMQTFLKNRGYNISVDGVRGPETNAAVLAFHNHVDPQKYSSKGKSVTTVTPSKTPHGNPGDSAAAVSVVPAKRGRQTATATPPSTGNPALDALINPAAYAAGQTNAIYNPQIAELQRQIALGGKQAIGNQSDIAAWYKQLDDLANSTHKANTDAATANQTGYDNSAATIGGLFGGQNSDPAFHDIQSGLLRANAQTDSAFDQHLKTILGASGAQAAVNQKTRDTQAGSDLASKLLDLKGAKGQAYATAYQQGLQNRTQQEAAQQSLKLAQQLAPSQIASAKATATAATVNAKNAAAVAAANLKLINANVKKATATANASGGWNLSRPNDRGQLTAALRTGLQTKLGGFRIDPISATSNLQQSLLQAGLQNDPQAQAIANSLIQETLNNAHSKHLWGGFKWDGTKVVRSGKHFDPKTGKLVKGQNG